MSQPKKNKPENQDPPKTVSKAKQPIKTGAVKKATAVKPKPTAVKKPTKKPAPAKKKAATKKRRRGRPTIYSKTYCEQARKLCLLGATDDSLADFFGVNVDTINEWKKRHPEFSVSIKAGKDAADGEVADRLYQRAMGFEHDSEEIKVVPQGKGIPSEVVRVKVRKIYAPDPTAAIFWLKNRQKTKWRDRQEVEHSGTVERPYAEMDDDELEQEIKRRGGTK